MYPGVDPTCDKCKGAPASLYHMYWTCPSLDNFWTSVFHALSGILHHRMEPSPLSGVFGIAPDLNLPKAMPFWLSPSSSFLFTLAQRHDILHESRED